MSIIGGIVGSISKAVLPSVIDNAFTDTGSLAHESLHVQASSAAGATGPSIPHGDPHPAIGGIDQHVLRFEAGCSSRPMVSTLTRWKPTAPVR